MMKKNVITKNRIRFLVKNDKQGEQVFKALLDHPMETGLRRNYKTRELIPADYIDTFRVSVDEKIVFELTMGPMVSKNPYVSFVFTKPLTEHQKMRVGWIENNGNEIFYNYIVKYGRDGSIRFGDDSKATVIREEVPAITTMSKPYCRQKATGATNQMEVNK